MASELFSFRLSGSELEWLKSQQLEGETLNLTAKRILLNSMTQPVYTPVDTPVDTMDIEARLEQKIDEKIEAMYEQLTANINYVLDARLPKEQLTVETSEVPLDKPLEEHTINELRSIAKSLDIPYKSRDKKEVLILKISERKSTLRHGAYHVP